MIKFICLAFIVAAIIFQGCGVTSVPSSLITVEMRQINVVATDGVLKNVNVRLASLLNGGISEIVQTDDEGKATINIRADVLDGLLDQDVIYLYVDSINESTVSINANTNNDKQLEIGQVRIKSYIGTGKSVKSIAEVYERLHDDPEISRRSIVSHFSNSVAVMIEAEFKKNGLITESIRPEKAYLNLSTKTLNEVETKRKQLEEAQTERDSKLARKLKLITIATKGLIEQNISDFLDDEKTTRVNQGSEAILDLAVNSTAKLEPSFQTQLSQLSDAVENDVKNNSDIRASLSNPDAVFEAMDFLSVNDVIQATSIKDIFLEVSVAEGLSSSTTYKHVKKLIDLNHEIRGGEFTANSFLPEQEGNFVYNP